MRDHASVDTVYACGCQSAADSREGLAHATHPVSQLGPDLTAHEVLQDWATKSAQPQALDVGCGSMPGEVYGMAAGLTPLAKSTNACLDRADREARLRHRRLQTRASAAAQVRLSTSAVSNTAPGTSPRQLAHAADSDLLPLAG